VNPSVLASNGRRRFRNAVVRGCKLVVAGVALALVTALMSGTARSAADGEVLRVGTSGDYPPFSQALDVPSAARTKSAAYEGFDLDVARAFAAAQNLRLEIIRFAWPSLLDDLAADRFDVAMGGITVRPERSIAGRYSVPVLETSALVLVEPSNGPINRTALNKPNVRLVVNAGGHLERVARRTFDQAEIHALPDNSAVHMAFLDRSFDGVVTDSVEAQRWDPKHRYRRIEPLTNDRKAYLMRQDAHGLAAKLDAFLLSAEADGTLGLLRKHWFGTNTKNQPARVEFALLAAIDERLSLMPHVARFKAANGRAIEDPARETIVLDAAVNATQRAATINQRPMPNHESVRALFAALIEAAKEIQTETAELSSHSSQPTYDLETALRPALLAIGERLSRLLVQLEAPISTARAVDLIDEHIHSYDLSTKARRDLAQALSAISRR
jgi:cyclohexadienyl dehydratase